MSAAVNNPRRGRKPVYDLTQDEADALRAIVLARSTSGRHRVSLAIEEFPNHPACLPATADWIRARLDWYRARDKRPQWPLSMRRAARVTAATEALFRGPRALAVAAPHIRRGDTWIDAAGQRRALAPFHIFESDDVSINEPFRWRDPDTGHWLAGRQTLVTVDVGAAAMLGATCVGRPKDAYRQEDIADHFLDVCEQFGMPEVWRLERGSWAASFVRGIEAEGLADRWGALDALWGVTHTLTARGKGLCEERFDMLQSLLAHTEGGTTIGRTAGEFEAAARLMRRVGYDRRRVEGELPSDQAAVMRLWSIEDAADAVRRAMERANARPVERAMWSGCRVPAELLRAASKGRAIPAAERWRFHPVKRTAVVRRGAIEVRVDNYPQPFRFAVNGAVHGLYLDDNYPVFIAFHPGRPQAGACIANRERGVRNRAGWGMGTIIHRALPYLPDQPQVDLTTTSGARGAGLGKRFAASTRADFRGVRDQLDVYRAHRGRQIAAEALADNSASARRAEARDGYGNRVEHAGTALPLPDLAALRARSLLAEGDDEDAEITVDPLGRFRRRSLLTAAERSTFY